MPPDTSAPNPIDPTEPVEIAHRIWWVGHYLEGDPFQCHVYLLEHGDQSVLFDPGSTLTFSHTLAKIRKILPLDNIRYFVCHHQDPDIASSLPLLDKLIARDDAAIVTHWRAKALLLHYGIKIPFWLVDEHDWELDLGGRLLKFVFTPYAHFPGAFATFDTHGGVLFSSDLFGGFSEGFNLFAQDKAYFTAMRPFHEHYIPSHEILAYAISQFEKLPVRMIAPQHGSIIPQELVAPMMDGLKGLDCGLYLLAGADTNVHRLSDLSRNLRDVTKAMTVFRDFGDIAKALLAIVQRQLPARSLEFYTQPEGGSMLHLAPQSRYRDVLAQPPAPVREVLGLAVAEWERRYETPFAALDPYPGGRRAILVPLAGSGTITAVAVIELDGAAEPDAVTSEFIEQIRIPLQVAVERETLYRILDMQRQEIYERAIRDPLTGLYTRIYLRDAAERMFNLHDRNAGTPVGVAMFDVDFFKSINDRFGHHHGDAVLQRVAEVILKSSRAADLPVRLGGEEFALFATGSMATDVGVVARRILRKVQTLTFAPPMNNVGVTVSAGIAVRRQGESLDALIQRADAALYQAKDQGRNRVCAAPDSAA